MICDDCEKRWYWQPFDSAYRVGLKACHFCFYNGISRGKLVDGHCPHQVEEQSPELIMRFRKQTNPFKGGGL